ncbi:MAG: DUF4258 domain-containing protein [Bacteroidetes bacterium]|nr:DUF4258 domain-containing protein [Bacteroidota bacterium]
MLKKYLPLLALATAAFLLWYIKTNQRGKFPQAPANTDTHITVPVHDNGTATISSELPFSRQTTHLIYTKHARCRMDCRHIDESEVKEILQEGKLNAAKIEESDKGKSYPLEGETHDHQHVRIVFAPKADGLVVVTVIDLDTEWTCDCQ